MSYGFALYLYGRAALRGRRSELAALSLIWVLIAAVSAYILFGILGIMTGDGLGSLLARSGRERIWTALAAGILKFSLGRFVLALFNRKKDGPTRLEDCMMGGTCLLMFFLVIGIFSLESGRLSQSERYSLSLMILCGMLGLTAAVGLFYRLLGRYQSGIKEAEYERAVCEQQKKQIHDLYRIGRQANHMRHDMKIKLDVVYELLKKGEYHKAEEGIKRLGCEWGDYPELPQETGNEGLNAALLKAARESHEQGVKFRYVVMGKTDGIDSLDMGNLVYNLLKNGIEASARTQGEREVEIVARNDASKTEIEVINSICGSVIKENPWMQSQKENRSEHGFGMKSIREIVEKYHGEYVYAEEGNLFIQKIILKTFRAALLPES